MDIHFSRRFTFIWLHAVIVILVFATPEDDDKFVELYGTDRMTSGAWELISKYPYGDDQLFNFAKEAHRAAGMGVVDIIAAVCESRWLDFYDPQKYNFIRIDVLVYAIKGYENNETGIPYFFYFTKGLRPDCVYYLKNQDSEAMRLTLDRHVCGVHSPTK